MRARVLALFGALLIVAGWVQPVEATSGFDLQRGTLIKGTVVTMDDAGTVLRRGNVFGA